MSGLYVALTISEHDSVQLNQYLRGFNLKPSNPLHITIFKDNTVEWDNTQIPELIPFLLNINKNKPLGLFSSAANSISNALYMSLDMNNELYNWRHKLVQNLFPNYTEYDWAKFYQIPFRPHITLTYQNASDINVNQPNLPLEIVTAVGLMVSHNNENWVKDNNLL